MGQTDKGYLPHKTGQHSLRKQNKGHVPVRDNSCFSPEGSVHLNALNIHRAGTRGNPINTFTLIYKKIKLLKYP